MHTSGKFLIVLVILVAGIAIASLFPKPQTASMGTSGEEIVWRKPVVDSRDTLLAQAVPSWAATNDGAFSELPANEDPAPAIQAGPTQSTPPALSGQYVPSLPDLVAINPIPRDPPAGTSAFDISEGRQHRLVDGDSLDRLAERYLGDASRAGEILAANRGKISNIDLLPVGIMIRIPAR